MGEKALSSRKESRKNDQPIRYDMMKTQAKKPKNILLHIVLLWMYNGLLPLLHENENDETHSIDVKVHIASSHKPKQRPRSSRSQTQQLKSSRAVVTIAGIWHNSITLSLEII